MRVLFDNDVVLDLVLDREPFVEAAAALFDMHERGRIDGYISGITLINVFYVTRKSKGMDVARQAVAELLTTLDVCFLDKSIMEAARVLALADYEDAVQHASATASGLDAIVTRNLDDYKNATLPVFAPTDSLKHLKAQTS
ncbi:MAG TPA: PIN domain-containing protein [Pyrinomonadaceae bacterium]|nr:PIN domain-containing protein [Pyrinomonadaceae bacterium]